MIRKKHMVYNEPLERSIMTKAKAVFGVATIIIQAVTTLISAIETADSIKRMIDERESNTEEAVEEEEDAY